MLIFLLHWRSYKVLKAYVKAYCKIKIKFFWRLRHKPSVVLARKSVLSPRYMSNVAFGSRAINIPKTDPIHQELMTGRQTHGLQTGKESTKGNETRNKLSYREGWQGHVKSWADFWKKGKQGVVGEGGVECWRVSGSKPGPYWKGPERVTALQLGLLWCKP